MSEYTLVTSIRKALKAHGAASFKMHGSPNSRKGEPDIIGCYRGHFFALEVKLDYNRLTKIQQQRLREWRTAGARVGVVRTVEQALKVAVYGEEVNSEEFR